MNFKFVILSGEMFINNILIGLFILFRNCEIVYFVKIYSHIRYKMDHLLTFMFNMILRLGVDNRHRKMFLYSDIFFSLP